MLNSKAVALWLFLIGASVLCLVSTTYESANSNEPTPPLTRVRLSIRRNRTSAALLPPAHNYLHGDVFKTDGDVFANGTPLQFPVLSQNALSQIQKMSNGCKHRQNYLVFSVGSDHAMAYGGSNQVIALINMIHRAYRWNRILVWPESQLTQIVHSAHGFRYLQYLQQRFELKEFMQMFCIVETLPKGIDAKNVQQMEHPDVNARVHRISPNSAYYEHVNNFDKNHFVDFKGMVLAALYQKISPVLRDVVADVKSKLEANYTAVHLRRINPTTVKWTRRLQEKHDMIDQYTMHPNYVASLMPKDGKRVYLATDGQRPELTQALIDDKRTNAFVFNITNYPRLKDTPEIFAFSTTEQRAFLDLQTVDFVLLNEAYTFLGNDASSVSWNTVEFRRIQGVFRDNLNGPIL